MKKKQGLFIITVISAILLLSLNAFATLSAITGYDTYDATMDTTTGKSYSGGIDLVYSQVATGPSATKTRSFLKCEDGNWGTTNWSAQVNLYSYLGDKLVNFADVNPYGSAQFSIFCQGVKVDPTSLPGGNRTIWFSMTGSGASDGDWYSVVVDSNFTTVVTPAALELSQAGNWEVEWSTDTTLGSIPFFAGKETDAWTEPHAIYIESGGSLQKVIEVGGYSCGFAFDDAGNLYTGTYKTSGPSDQQYVRLYSASDIRNAISTSTVLLAGDSIVDIPIPSAGATGNIYLGVNDLERDPDGNIYVTANGSWNSQYNSDLGFVFRINAWTIPGTPPTSMTELASGTLDPNNPDWQKGLTYDGESNLAAGGHYNATSSSVTGNRLYVDQDFAWGTGGPDVISGLGDDTDSEVDANLSPVPDGVADCFDNAYLTVNSDQIDADLDMFGNMADADFNNDGGVTRFDYHYLMYTWGTSNPLTDMNSDGTVDNDDLTLLYGRATTSAPFY